MHPTKTSHQNENKKSFLFFMNLPLPPHNLTNKVFILIPNSIYPSHLFRASLILILIFVLLLLICLQFFAFYHHPIGTTETIEHSQRNPQTQTMKVHPLPKKRNISIQYDMNARNSLYEAQAFLGMTNKKLRRLPHVFSRVLELPFRSDADVSVDENPDCFRFVAKTDRIGDVRAHTVEIHPGVTKIVVRDDELLELSLNDLEVDMWRFRLPESTRPELAVAVFVNGALVVTVPKGEGLEGSIEGGDDGSFGGSIGGRLVLVQ